MMHFVGRGAAEGYAVLGILGCYACSAVILGIGFGRWLDGRRWSGGGLLAIGGLLGLTATLVGGSGCLPWQWLDCLSGG